MDATFTLGLMLEEDKAVVWRGPMLMGALQQMRGQVAAAGGKLDEARAVLEKAYGLRDDPEIAAHLGEVLWTQGRRDDATRLLKAAVRKHPDNEVLAAAVKKFAP